MKDDDLKKWCRVKKKKEDLMSGYRVGGLR